MQIRIPPTAIAFALLVGPLASGQSPSRPLVSVRGVVFDSVRGRPLPDAFVTIRGGDQSTTTDARGRFKFDSVPEGTRTFEVQHAVLDSLGFTGLSKRATLKPGEAEINVAVPSFATLWHNVCGTTRAPDDSGLVYGTIRDARTKKPVADALLEATWAQLTVGDKRRIVDRHFKSTTRTGVTGNYAVCGVPVDEAVHVQAKTASAMSGEIALGTAGLRVQRRDLYIGSSDARARGTIVGLLTDPSGGPAVDARVMLDDSIEVRSDFDGRFVLRNVMSGSRQLEVRHIGTSPVLSVVDVMAGDTALVAIEVPKATMLATVNVTSSERARMLREELEERKIMYHHYMIDTTEIMKNSSMSNIFYGVSGVRVRRNAVGDFTLLVPDPHGGLCTPELRVDGAMVNDFGFLTSLPPARVVSVEVYPHAFDIPAEYQRTGVRSPCGLVAVWTRWALHIP